MKKSHDRYDKPRNTGHTRPQQMRHKCECGELYENYSDLEDCMKKHKKHDWDVWGVGAGE